jgi:hypothetical protein
MSNVLKMAAVGGAVSAETDPNFKQTVLLLHGDGTNGAQNNTFLDSSTNNFTITRNGNTTQGTFSPFSVGAGEWSNYFDGTGDYLTAPQSLTDNSFTVEGWFYSGSTALQTLFCQAPSGSTTSETFSCYLSSGAFYVQWGGSPAFVTAAYTLNAWNYFAASYDQSTETVTGYLNGSSIGTFSAASRSIGNYTTGIGHRNTTNLMVGYISNLRVLNGTALTISGVPTAPLTAITNTSLLSCQSNRFVDNSTNAFAITRNGDVRVTPFSPFAPSAAYDPAVNGGSGYFDGTSDWLSAASNAAFDCGTGNWTLEAWVYILSESNAYPIICGNANSAYATAGSLAFGNHNTDSAIYNNKFIITGRDNDSTGSNLRFADSTTHPLNTWIHIAVVRDSSTTLKMYRDGVLVASTSNIPSGYTFNWGLNGFRIGGGNWDGTNRSEINGYISNLRLIKGQSLTTGAFTPPAEPLQSGVVGWTGANVAASITGTEAIITNFTNAGIFDNTGKNNLETVGNAQIDTTTKKYGTGSMEFDGNGDWLQIPRTVDLDFNAGDFTIELWVNPSSTSVSSFVTQSSVNSNGWALGFSSVTAGRVWWYSNSTAVLTSSSSLSTGVWTHVAIVRSGSTLTMYFNGTSVGSTTNTTSYVGSSIIYVGSDQFSQHFNGYIDDLRITKGVARYTSNFTAPTKAFPDQ